MNRQREGLKQSVEAEGHTDSFSMLKLKDGIDLRSLGCHGPAEKVEKPTQAVHCLNGFVSISTKNTLYYKPGGVHSTSFCHCNPARRTR